MTQPTDQPTNEKQQRVKRGGRTILDNRKQIHGKVTQATAERVVVEFAGTVDLDKQVTDLGADTQAHLVFTVAHVKELTDLTVKVFIDTPDANADTPPGSPGFVGTVAFFEHEGGHGRPEFRVPLTAALKRSGPRQKDLTATLVPVGYPGRARAAQPLMVNASLRLVRSKVERK